MVLIVWKNRQTGASSDFERGLIIGVHLAGASGTKPATLLGVSTVTISMVMSPYTMHHGKTTSVKRNSGQKSTVTERDRHTLKIV
jgi:hypothetical protein